jgi:hypothetical protein
MITFFTFRRPIIAGWGRYMGMILWPIRNSIRICGWRLDRLVDPIKIGFTGSPTLRPRTCGWPIVFQPLGAPNQYRAPNLRSSWPYSNTRLSSPINSVCTTESGACTTKSGGCTTVCITKSGAWTASRICHEHGITEWWNMCASSFLAI